MACTLFAFLRGSAIAPKIAPFLGPPRLRVACGFDAKPGGRSLMSEKGLFSPFSPFLRAQQCGT